MKIEVREVQPSDVVEMLHNIRSDDADELFAHTGLPTLNVLVRGLELPGESFACLVDGKLLALYGAVLMDESLLTGRRGRGWLLTTTLVDQLPKTFWKLTKQELPKLMSRWTALENFIDMRHKKALRWGERLGFVFDEEAPFGVHHAPSKRFVITKEGLKCVVQP